MKNYTCGSLGASTRHKTGGEDQVVGSARGRPTTETKALDCVVGTTGIMPQPHRFAVAALGELVIDSSPRAELTGELASRRSQAARPATSRSGSRVSAASR
jgi:hypothetical protein